MDATAMHAEPDQTKELILLDELHSPVANLNMQASPARPSTSLSQAIVVRMLPEPAIDVLVL